MFASHCLQQFINIEGHWSGMESRKVLYKIYQKVHTKRINLGVEKGLEGPKIAKTSLRDNNNRKNLIRLVS